MLLLACVFTPIADIHAQNISGRADALPIERPLLTDFSERASDAIAAVTSHALSLIGVRYKFGSENPERGLDCSGLIRHVFQQATGLSLPRSAREQARIGDSVALNELQPGDLVFFNTRRFQFSHVGIYLGNNQFIHAPSRGKAVEIVRLDQAYWQRAFNGARRIIDAVPALAAATIAPSVQAAPRDHTAGSSGSTTTATSTHSLPPEVSFSPIAAAGGPAPGIDVRRASIRTDAGPTAARPTHSIDGR